MTDALTLQIDQEIQRRIDDPATSDDERRTLLVERIKRSQNAQTVPAVGAAALDRPAPVPAGSREELIAAQGPDRPSPRSGGPAPISGTAEFRAGSEVQGDAAVQGIVERGRELVDFFRRLNPFMTDEQETELGQRRLQQRSEELASILQEADALGVPRAAIEQSQTAGGLAPDLGLMLIPMLGTTIPARIGAEALTTGILVGSEVPLGEGGLAVALGAGVLGGGAFGLVAEVPGIVKQFVAGDVRKAVQKRFGSTGNFPRRDPFRPTPESQATGIPQTVGETTASGRVLSIEAELQGKALTGGPAETFAHKRAEAAVKQYGKVVDAIDPTKVGTKALIDGMEGARATATKAIKDSASAQWRGTLGPSLNRIGARFGPLKEIIGGPQFIRTDNVVAEMRRIRSVASAPITNNPEVVKWADKQLADIADAGGLLPIGRYQEIVSSLGAGAVTDGAARNSNSLIRAMKTDLDDTKAAFGGEGPMAAVVDSLKEANAAYAVAIKPADEINAIFAKKLGLDNPALSAEQWANKWGKLDPTQKNIVLKQIAKHAPELSQTISARFFAETLQKHKVLSKVDKFEGQDLQVVDMVGFAKAMTKRSFADMKAMFNMPNMSVEQANAVRAAFRQLNLLRDTPNVTGAASTGFMQRIREGMINIVSRDEGFLSRFLAGEFTPGALERWMYTEKGLNALLDLGRVSFKPSVVGAQATAEAALVTLMGLSADGDAEREALERELKRQRAQHIAAGGRAPSARR